MLQKKLNTWKKGDGCWIGKSSSGEEFIIDLEDYDAVRQYTWRTKGYSVWSSINRKPVSLASFIIGDHSGKILRYDNQSFDYRRKNLYAGNIYEQRDGYMICRCFGGQEIKFDTEDYDLIRPYQWHVDKNGYAISKSSDKIYKMHRLIMGIVDDANYEVDHIHHDLLDNRKSELRLVTRSQNCYNRRRGKSNTSGCVGVYWSNPAQKWCAQINTHGERRYLGSFDKYEDAVSARRNAEQSETDYYRYSE